MVRRKGGSRKRGKRRKRRSLRTRLRRALEAKGRLLFVLALGVLGALLGVNVAINGFLYLAGQGLRTEDLLVLDRPRERVLAVRMLAAHWLLRHRAEEQDLLLGAIGRAAAESGVDPRLLWAMAQVESAGRCHAVSPKGACGPFQLLPSTALAMGIHDPFCPDQAATAAARYVARLERRFHHDITLVIAAYHAGPTCVERFGAIPPYPETADHVRKVLGAMRRAPRFNR